MKRTLHIAALAFVGLSAAAVPVLADSNSTIYGPNGVSTVNRDNNCYDHGNGGTCNRNVTAVGPNGESYNRNRTMTCENGICTGNKSVNTSTGVNRGRTVTISR
ncbi:hypothetical protein [Pseudoruegeria sp. HB172150]|uniref:hypothetical protein n=1 Tax=Pseudoruegeria sp. HB172150 TaxID=2721164 RepID=UPI00155517C3|nr:hypothetical protein [Pseudoruegeria sp. HB172150]